MSHDRAVQMRGAGSADPGLLSPQRVSEEAAAGAAGSMQQAQAAWPRLDHVLSYVILACGVLTFVVGAYQILSSQSHVPIWDEWLEIDAVAMAPQHQPPPSWLWSQHNEHRVVFYRLLLLADIGVFHGAHRVFFWSMLVVQCAFLALLLHLVRLEGLRGPRWRVIAGLSAFCLFCPSQWENFGWAFQISFLLPGMFLTSALAGLLAYARSERMRLRSWTGLGLSILAASAATYSNANGVVVWPVLLIIAAVLRLRPWVLVLYGVSGTALIGSYLYHYTSPSYHSSPWQSLSHPLALLGYAARFLGVVLPPWMRSRDLVAVSTGALGILAALGAALWVIQRRGWRKPLPAAMLGLMLFSLATALITALGRVGLGSSQAFQSRYQTYNLLFWLSTLTLWFLIGDQSRPILRRIILAAMPVAMLLAAGMLFPLCLRASRMRILSTEAAAMPLLTGVPDKQALAGLYPDPSLPWRDAEYFREQRLFMFSVPAWKTIDVPLESAYHAGARDRCLGQVELVQRIPPSDLVTTTIAEGLRISGSAVNGNSGAPIRRLVIAANGKVAGFAVGGLQLVRTDKTYLKKPAFNEWSGSVRLPPKARSLDVYAVDEENRICPIGTAAVPAR